MFVCVYTDVWMHSTMYNILYKHIVVLLVEGHPTPTVTVCDSTAQREIEVK